MRPLDMNVWAMSQGGEPGAFQPKTHGVEVLCGTEWGHVAAGCAPGACRAWLFPCSGTEWDRLLRVQVLKVGWISG